MSDSPFKSIPDMLRYKAVTYPSALAIKYKNNKKNVSISYEQYFEMILKTAKEMRGAGVCSKDKIAIVAPPNIEWTLTDIAAQILGAIVIPIHRESCEQSLCNILNNAECKFVFISNQMLYDILLAIRSKLLFVEFVISFENLACEARLPAIKLDATFNKQTILSEQQKEKLVSEIANININDIFTIMYTPGTTDEPKGVPLSYHNVLSSLQGYARKNNIIGQNHLILNLLPFSHALGRFISFYFVLYQTSCLVFDGDLSHAQETLKDISPHCIVGIPQIFKLLYEAILNEVNNAPIINRALFNYAMGSGYKYVKKIDKKVKVNVRKSIFYRLSEIFIFDKIKKKYGLDRIICFVCGGAFLDANIIVFFWAMGLPILEGYGLTETCDGITINSFDAVKIGSVGQPIENVNIKVDNDGEILVKGDQLFHGYYKNKTLTDKIFDKDGWFKTGDTGKIDSDGFLYIVNRKEDAIITSGGINIVTEHIERKLTSNKYIRDAFIFGDDKNYIIALIVPHIKNLEKLMAKKGLKGFHIDELVGHHVVLRFYREQVEKINNVIPEHEYIKKFHILTERFSVKGSEFTPHMNLRRKKIYEKYKEIIDELYE